MLEHVHVHVDMLDVVCSPKCCFNMWNICGGPYPGGAETRISESRFKSPPVSVWRDSGGTSARSVSETEGLEPASLFLISSKKLSSNPALGF